MSGLTLESLSGGRWNHPGAKNDIFVRGLVRIPAETDSWSLGVLSIEGGISCALRERNAGRGELDSLRSEGNSNPTTIFFCHYLQYYSQYDTGAVNYNRKMKKLPQNRVSRFAPRSTLVFRWSITTGPMPLARERLYYTEGIFGVTTTTTTAYLVP